MENLSNTNYKVIKVFNNNVLFVSHDKNEKILFGKGIGFGKRTGDIIANSIKIDKIFSIEDKSNNNNFNELASKLDNNFIGLCEEVIYMISNEFDKELNERIHISLIDHIAYTIKRLKENNNLNNPFLVEIETLYKKEYEIAGKAVKILEDRLKISIPDDEIGFIALHIHSSINKEKVSTAYRYTYLCSKIISFIEEALSIKIDKKSLDYARFLTHIRFAIERIINGIIIKNELLDVIKSQYSDSYEIAIKVSEIIQADINVKVVEEEVAYIAMHIQRIKSSIM
jgi:transcriptional antiterminator